MLAAVKIKDSGYLIKNTKKLKEFAQFLDILIKNRSIEEIVKDVAQKILQMFEGEPASFKFFELAPKSRQQLWQKLRGQKK